MTQSTFVRLGDADLASMAKRLTVILTDEGAHAWYKHDVAELLQEIVAMRQERAHAIASFREHDPLRDVPDNLPSIAAAWRESVTGLWEKAQVKKLRAETTLARNETAELADELAKARDTISMRVQEREALRDQLNQSKADRDVLADELVKANNMILDLEETGAALQTQLEQTIRAYDAKLAEVREQRAVQVERITELEAQVSALMDEQANEQQRVAAVVKAVEETYTSHAQKAKNLLSEAQMALGA
jgi:chromosome segregation ATPase